MLGQVSMETSWFTERWDVMEQICVSEFDCPRTILEVIMSYIWKKNFDKKKLWLWKKKKKKESQLAKKKKKTKTKKKSNTGGRENIRR